MNRILPLIPLLAALSVMPAADALPFIPSQQNVLLGMNMSHAQSFTGEMPFTDLVRCSGGFVSSKTWLPFAAGAVNKRGFPQQLNAGEFARLYFSKDSQAIVQHEDLLIAWDGTKEFTSTFGWSFASANERPVLGTVQVEGKTYRCALVRKSQPNANGLYLDVKAPINDLKVMRSGSFSRAADGTWRIEAGVFHHSFLDAFRNARVFRFMDWGRANTMWKYVGNGTDRSAVITWADLPQETDAFWFGNRGVPFAAMIDLCNALDIDPWFTLPVKVDATSSDDRLNVVRNLATLVKTRLKPGLRPYVEIGNETWGFNDTYVEGKYNCIAAGRAYTNHLTTASKNDYYYLQTHRVAHYVADTKAKAAAVLVNKDTTSAAYQTTYGKVYASTYPGAFEAEKSEVARIVGHVTLSSQVWRVFDQVLGTSGNADRPFRRVIGSWHGGPNNTERYVAEFKRLSPTQPNAVADVVAIAPYVSVSPSGASGNRTVRQILDTAKGLVAPGGSIAGDIAKHVRALKGTGVGLAGYEGGIGYKVNSADQTLVDAYIAATRHPETKAVLEGLIKVWRTESGKLDTQATGNVLCLLTSIDGPQTVGERALWGHLEWLGQDPWAPAWTPGATTWGSPKMQGFITAAQTYTAGWPASANGAVNAAPVVVPTSTAAVQAVVGGAPTVVQVTVADDAAANRAGNPLLVRWTVPAGLTLIANANGQTLAISAAKPGTYTLSAEAFDGFARSTQPTRITVNALGEDAPVVNTPPTASDPADVQVNAGASVGIALQGVDAEDPASALRVRLSARPTAGVLVAPNGLPVLNSTDTFPMGVFTYTADAKATGVDGLAFQVIDSQRGVSATTAVGIAITRPNPVTNTSPTASRPNPVVAVAGQWSEVTLVGSDLEDGAASLRVTFPVLPAGRLVAPDGREVISRLAFYPAGVFRYQPKTGMPATGSVVASDTFTFAVVDSSHWASVKVPVQATIYAAEPEIRFASQYLLVDEGGTLKVRVQRLGNPSAAVSANVAVVVPQTTDVNLATPGADLVAGPFPVSWGALDTNDKIISIPTVVDGIPERLERASLVIDQVQGGTITGSYLKTVSLAIRDQDAGVIGLPSAAIVVNESATAVKPITVSRSGAGMGRISATWAVTTQGGAGAADFLEGAALSGALVWEDGDTSSRTIELPTQVRDDALVEAPESAVLSLVLDASSVGTIATPLQALVINDDDGQAIAAPWTSTAIGWTPMAGGAVQQDDWLCSGSGFLYGVNDGLRFIHQPLGGAQGISAGFSGLRHGGSAEVGVALRNGLSAQGAAVYFTTNAAGQAALRVRNADGTALSAVVEPSRQTILPLGATLRLTMQGGYTVAAWRLADQDAWTTFAQVPTPMFTAPRAGVVVSSQSGSAASWAEVQVRAASLVTLLRTNG